jgi:hypothetical protein
MFPVKIRQSLADALKALHCVQRCNVAGNGDAGGVMVPFPNPQVPLRSLMLPARRASSIARYERRRRCRCSKNMACSRTIKHAAAKPVLPTAWC